MLFRSPHDTESLISLFSKENLALVGSHFGRIEDLKTDNKTNMHTDQLGYTNAAVDFHTDQPFIENTPRFQMLHCIQVADQGGESGIANAKQAALYLKSIDPNAFDILCQTPVTFHRKQHAFESIRKGPLITLRGEDVYQVRFSYFTMAPHTLPFDQMIPWYQAYRRYINLVKDPRHHYSFQLQKGEFVLYDNFIMFHARKAFTGSRWMKGVYFTPKSTP